MKYEIRQTRKIDSEFCDNIRANSEHYFDTSKLTDKDIVEALQEMDNPKHEVTKSLNRLLNGTGDSCDSNHCVSIAIHGMITI